MIIQTGDKRYNSCTLTINNVTLPGNSFGLSAALAPHTPSFSALTKFTEETSLYILCMLLCICIGDAKPCTMGRGVDMGHVRQHIRAIDGVHVMVVLPARLRHITWTRHLDVHHFRHIQHITEPYLDACHAACFVLAHGALRYNSLCRGCSANTASNMAAGQGCHLH